MPDSKFKKELVANLPPFSALELIDDIEKQTCAVLALLTEQSASKPCTVPVDYMSCPNCGAFAESNRSPYCSDECREMAAFVRQFRSAVLDGSLVNPERQGALGQKLWFVLGGGYPRRDVLVPARVRLKVLEREGNKCQQCGAKATTIDHSGSG